MGCWQLGSDVLVRPHLVLRYGFCLWKSLSFPFCPSLSFHMHWLALCSSFSTPQISIGQSSTEVRKQAMKSLQIPQQSCRGKKKNADTCETYQRNVATFSVADVSHLENWEATWAWKSEQKWKGKNNPEENEIKCCTDESKGEKKEDMMT